MNSREYPTHPMIGVGVVVFNQDNNILLVQRGKEPSSGLWALPGGLVEVGEDLKTAAKRETEEECNIDIIVGEVATVVDLILKDEEGRVKYHYVLVNYYADFMGGELSPQSDVSDAKWFSQREVADLNIPEVTRKVIDKAFGQKMV